MENSKFQKSESIKEIAGAIAKFQSEVHAVTKDGQNPYFKSKYATLENIIETIRKPLEANGLSFSQFPSGDNELVTILMHKTGEYLQATAKITPKDNTPQGQGSAITYMRRYALSSILGLATEEDDDGNAASKSVAKSKTVESAPKAVAKTESKVIPNVKVQIFNKVKKLNPKVNKDNVKEIVKSLTDLDLVGANYDEINSRLDVKLSEANPTK